MYRKTTEELLEFLEKSPTPFHAVQLMEDLLRANGYEACPEHSRWTLQKGGQILCDKKRLRPDCLCHSRK